MQKSSKNGVKKITIISDRSVYRIFMYAFKICCTEILSIAILTDFYYP